MAAATHSVTLDGLSGRPIEVEVDIGGGLPQTILVGLVDTMVNEARDRCRSAVSNSGTTWPDQRVTINLAPSTLPKSGSHYDLAIALAVFAAKSLIPVEQLAGAAFLGELALDGRLRAIRGVLPATLAAAEAGFDRVFVPEVNVPEAELVQGISVVGVRSLRQTVALLTGQEEPDDPPVPPLDDVPSISWTSGDRLSHLDLADISGQEDSRMALLVAAAGGHHVLMTGPPGIGKTMLAQRLPGLLPDLTREQSLSVSAVHSVAGVLSSDSPLLTRPPFLDPHHTASAVSIVGGGSKIIRPGALSLAHHGMLFYECKVVDMTGTAAIYLRISKDSKRLGLGVDRQEEACRELADREGLTVGKDAIFKDNDISASTNSRKPRPAYDAMVAAVRAGEFTHVVSHSNTRLTRRMRELEDLIDLHNETGVQYFTVVSGNDNLSTATGRQMARIKGSIAAGEAELTSERVKAAAKQRAELGKPKHSRHRTFGYDAGFKAIPAEADVIRDAFERVVRGESVSSIAMLWRATGVNMGNGKDVHYSTVKNVVRRHLYAALSTYKGEVVGRSSAEPIVSEALFYAAQDVLDRKRNPRSGKNARRYLLAGLIQCGECGHVLYGSHTYTNKSGNSRHSYICKTHMQGCGKVSVMGHHVEEMVLTMVKRRMTMKDAVEVPALIDYQTQIDDLEAQMQAARSDVSDGLLTFLDIRETLIDLSQKKTVLEALAVDQLDKSDQWMPTSWNDYKTASLSEQMSTVGSVIHGVVVFSATSKKWDAGRVTIYTKRGNIINGKDVKSDVGDMRKIVAGFRDTPVKPTKTSRPVKGDNGKFRGSLPA